MLIIFLIFALISFKSINSANILVIPANAGASHAKSMMPISETLSQNGHDVFMLQMPRDETQIAKISPKSKIQSRMIMWKLTPEEKAIPFKMPSFLIWGNPLLGQNLVFPWRLVTEPCKRILDDKQLRMEFDNLIRERKWDLIFVDDIFTPCGMVAVKEAKKYSNVSVINFGTTLLMPKSQEVRGLPIRKSVYPAAVKAPPGSYDHRSFTHRLFNYLDCSQFNLMENALEYLVPYWLDMPRNEYSASSLFALHSDLLMASLSPMLEFTKPMANEIIELDVDCPKKAQLSEKYQKIVDDPKSKGTVIFAMGHMANWDEVPPQVFQSFNQAFEKLVDYRIIWQYASDNAKPEMPQHVILDDWVPQSALLYHPKTKLFISHVGGKSLREAICAGVPVVTMPLFAEQYRNAAIARKRGMATYLDKTNLSPTAVYEAITAILDDPNYSKNAKALQKQMDDRIIEPMSLGRFWSEFIMRHNPSAVKKYFRMRWQKLSYLASDNFDVFVILGAFGYGLTRLMC